MIFAKDDFMDNKKPPLKRPANSMTISLNIPCGKDMKAVNSPKEQAEFITACMSENLSMHAMWKTKAHF